MKTKKYSKEEADQKLPPTLWEYTKAPWYFGLAVKNFRHDPQLAMEVANVMNDKANLPISRAEMKRQKQIGSAAARVRNDTATVAAPYTVPTARASASTSYTAGGISSVEVVSSVEQKKLLWAKVTASKALKENTNIAKRMGKMEELAQGMSLLEKMRQACTTLYRATISNSRQYTLLLVSNTIVVHWSCAVLRYTATGRLVIQ